MCWNSTHGAQSLVWNWYHYQICETEPLSSYNVSRYASEGEVQVKGKSLHDSTLLQLGSLYF